MRWEIQCNRQLRVIHRQGTHRAKINTGTTITTREGKISRTEGMECNMLLLYRIILEPVAARDKKPKTNRGLDRKSNRWRKNPGMISQNTPWNPQWSSRAGGTLLTPRSQQTT
jgi:hypothetical protein